MLVLIEKTGFGTERLPRVCLLTSRLLVVAFRSHIHKLNHTIVLGSDKTSLRICSDTTTCDESP